jgi:hypothetical protein
MKKQTIRPGSLLKSLKGAFWAIDVSIVKLVMGREADFHIHSQSFRKYVLLLTVHNHI